MFAARGPSLPSRQGLCLGHPAHGLLPAQDLNAEAFALATVNQGQVRAPAGLRELLAMTPHSWVSSLCLWTCSGCWGQGLGLKTHTQPLLCGWGSGAAQ